MNWADLIYSGWEKTSRAEIVSVIFALLSVWYARKASVLTYPFGIVGVCIQAWLCFFTWELYADGSINLYFLAMSIYGWVMWTRKSEDSSKVSWAGTSENAIAALLSILSFGGFYYVLTHFTNSTVPFWDALTAAGSVGGMYLMAKKRIENWIYWIVIDVISTPLYAFKGAWFVALQFVVFTALAIAGLRAWVKLEREKLA